MPSESNDQPSDLPSRQDARRSQHEAPWAPSKHTLVPAQDPTCAKVSITGRMLPVPSSELPLAEQMLFSRHPVMRTWPDDHSFTACVAVRPTQAELLYVYVFCMRPWLGDC